MAQSAKVPVICEYFIQNDFELQDAYRNVFILPNKYSTIKDVKVRDVLKAFPMSGKDANYVLRFQYVMEMASKKTKPVWLDVVKNRLDGPCPHVQGKIIIKALRLPQGVWPKYQSQLDSSVPPPLAQQQPGHLAGRFSNLSVQENQRSEQQPKQSAQTVQKPKSANFIGDDFPSPTVNQKTPPPMRQSDMMRAARRGESFEGMMDGGATPGGPAPVPDKLLEESKVNPDQFSSNTGPVHIPTPGDPSNDFNQANIYDPYSGYDQTKLGDGSQSSDEGYQNMDNQGNGDQRASNDFNDIFGNPVTENPWSNSPDQQPKEQEYGNVPDWTNDPFAGASSLLNDPVPQQQNQAPSQGFNQSNTADLLFDNDPPAQQPAAQASQPSASLIDTNFLGGSNLLDDISFAPTPTPGGPDDVTVKPQQPAQPKTRVEQVAQIEATRRKEEDALEVAKSTHIVRLEQWAGQPMKNHVRVLLCTLPDVLWQGHGFERVGMDKLMEPPTVKTAYRKYIARFHPDRIQSSGDAEKIFISTFVFAAITEQYKNFAKEHNMK